MGLSIARLRPVNSIELGVRNHSESRIWIAKIIIIYYRDASLFGRNLDSDKSLVSYCREIHWTKKRLCDEEGYDEKHMKNLFLFMTPNKLHRFLLWEISNFHFFDFFIFFYLLQNGLLNCTWSALVVVHRSTQISSKPSKKSSHLLP